MKIKVTEWVTEWKRFWYLPAMIVFGLVLMTFNEAAPQTAETAATLSEQQYIFELEERVENMLLSVTGAGKCDVTITLASGVQKDYVREEGAVLVITDKSGNEVPVIERERLPEIAGVTVVSTGAEDIRVQRAIIHSVGTLLDVGTNKICVVLREGSYYENQ